MQPTSPIGSPTSGFGAGWSLVKNLPEPVADRIVPAGRRPGVPPARAGVVQLRQEPAPGAGRAVDARVAGRRRPGRDALVRPVLEGDVPAARDGPRRGLRAGRGRPSIGAEHIDRAAASRAAASCCRCRTPATGTSPGCGSPARWGRLTTVVERLKPESLYEKFVAYRESLGMEVLPLTGGAGAPSHGAAGAARRRAAIIALVGDRDLSASGIPVTFFGETATDAGRAGDARRAHRCLPVPDQPELHRPTAGRSTSTRR